MNKRKPRFWVTDLGEYYSDCLAVEATLKNKSQSNEAASLLCAMLQQRTEKRESMVKYLAQKYELSYEDMWQKLVSGDIELDENDTE